MEHTLLRRLGVLLSVGALLALALVSCDGSTSFASAARTPLRAESATPAMTATPTSAVTSSPTTVELAMPDLTPASSAGWATYRDRRFGFAVPFPPGWQPASLIWPQDPVPSDYSGYVYYMVQFFPPGPHGEPGFGAVEKGPEVIQIIITLSGPSASLPHGTNPYLYPNFGMVALGSQQTSLYGLWLPSSELELGVVTTMANLPMNLGMHYMAIRQWDPAIAQRDVSVFLAMLKGYRPM